MTPQVLKQTLRKGLEDKNRDVRLAFGIRTESPWSGNGHIELDGGLRMQVQSCRSMLEMREALTSPERPLALVACFPDIETLSDDIRARLYRNQLIDVDLWQLVAERFGGTSVESRLRRDRPLGQRTLSWLDSRVPPLSASGVLSEGTLWTYVLRETVDISLDRRPDLIDILTWRSDPPKKRALFALPPEILSAIRGWLKRSMEDTADLILDSNADPLVVGIALLALRDKPGPRDTADWGLARGRLEKFFGDRPLTENFVTKYTAAAEAILDLRAQQRPEDVRSLVHESDDLLEKLGASHFAVRSRWSALGARQLLDQFASNLGDRNSLLELEQSFLRTDGHVIDRLQMSARLTRWLTSPEQSVSTVAKYAQTWLEDESWVDWSRGSIRNFTTDSADLNRSLAKLREHLSQRRDRSSLAFAKLLAAETHVSATVNGVLGVEDVLDSVVAPLTQLGRVLFVVMDGMSWPILREISRDIEDRRWVEYRRPDQLPAAVSTIPSVTQFSRCSLLSGKLSTGGPPIEDRNFLTRFPDACLFHKRDLVDFPRSKAAAEIGNEKRRLVAVVVNAIDDLLAGSEQTTESWSLGRLSLLQAILAEAANANRIVVMVSDHGHIVEQGTTRLAENETSDRWRTGQPNVAAEIAVSGPRVLAGKSVVALASESARYALQSHNGYHGGLTPQECLVPVVVYSQSELDANWLQVPSNRPSWWDLDEAPRPSSKTRPASAKLSGKPQASLFEQPRHWIDDLLASALFKDQIASTGGRMKPEQVEKLLRVLELAPGQRMLKQTFASQLQINAVRVSTNVAMMQRVLNLDGYSVLTLDEATGYISLHQDLLKKQFDL